MNTFQYSTIQQSAVQYLCSKAQHKCSTVQYLYSYIYSIIQSCPVQDVQYSTVRAVQYSSTLAVRVSMQYSTVRAQYSACACAAG